MLSRQIEKAQRKVESHNFDIRKQLLTFDDVANDQRKVIYSQRTEILGTEDLSASIRGMFGDALKGVFETHVAAQSMPSDWDLAGLRGVLQRDFGIDLPVDEWPKAEPEIDESAIRERVLSGVLSSYDERVQRYGAPIMRHVERQMLLSTLDHQWRDHLAGMDYLRQGIHLRGYAQKDYRYEYKREAFEMFSALLDRVKYEVVSALSRVEVRTQEQVERDEAERRERLMQALQAQHAEAMSPLEAQAAVDAEPGAMQGSAAPDTGEALLPGSTGVGGATHRLPPGGAQLGGIAADAPFVRGDRKVGRNEPCPCGSGRKYKHCHGTLAADG
jgi:preprotein translocase subunit SecA